MLSFSVIMNSDSYIFDGGQLAAAISLFDAPGTHPKPVGVFQVDSCAL